MTEPSDRRSAAGVGELARLFLKLGVIAFGGPAAHIAMMEDEVVSRRGWMSRQHFLDLIGATNLIPGPNSTEMTMHVGYERGDGRDCSPPGRASFFPRSSSRAVWRGSTPRLAPSPRWSRSSTGSSRRSSQ